MGLAACIFNLLIVHAAMVPSPYDHCIASVAFERLTMMIARSILHGFLPVFLNSKIFLDVTEAKKSGQKLIES